ncbi:MAG TPA: glycosyltransferase family 2 protein [Anaerolineaceae bacterium]|nr:glycosyltransferase family 2 protein [Anaerolineaceae bacterium]
MDLSICLVPLNALYYLEPLLASIEQYSSGLTYEVIVVDNGSTDGTTDWIKEHHPEISLTRNQANLGFTRGNNQAMEMAKGDFILLLNPDTFLTEDCFGPQLDFLRENPDIGITIPKVLNADGSFQQQSRRGDARPIEVFGYFLKLGKLFPQNKAFNGYLQSWLPEDEVAEVKAVSGSCMFIKREVYEKIGGLDERFFAYQEDSDYCLRARQAGWKVMYVPLSSIIHYAGEGGSKNNPYHSIFQWHRSYYLYYRKHFSREHFFLFNWFYYLVMIAKLLFAWLKRFVRGK